MVVQRKVGEGRIWWHFPFSILLRCLSVALNQNAEKSFRPYWRIEGFALSSSPFFTPSAASAGVHPASLRKGGEVSMRGQQRHDFHAADHRRGSVLMLSLSSRYCCCFSVPQKCKVLGALSPEGLRCTDPFSRLISSSSSLIP